MARKATTMTSTRSPNQNPDSKPGNETLVGPAEPADWVKPVELIELLQRRTAKRTPVQAPTSSPFYDADFVAKHPKNKRKRRKTAD
jgi:hypothetical protein